MEEETCKIEEIIYKDLEQLAHGPGLRKPDFETTRLIQAGILPGELKEQAKIYSNLVRNSVDHVQPASIREAICVKLNLIEGYPNSSNRKRLGQLGQSWGREVPKHGPDKGNNRQTENDARRGQKDLATLISEEIVQRNLAGNWNELAEDTAGTATARLAFPGENHQQVIPRSINEQDIDKSAVRPEVSRWSRLEVEWMIERLSFREGWDLSDDDYQACFIASRSWPAPGMSSRSVRLKALQRPLLSFLRARLERVSSENEARSRILRTVTDLVQSQAVRPTSAEEKSHCYATLNTYSTDGLRTIADSPDGLRELTAQIRAVADERGRERYERMRYLIGAHITLHYIEHGLGRHLTRGENQATEVVMQKASIERIPYKILLERLGRMLGLNRKAMATARLFFASGEAEEARTTLEANLFETYAGRLPPNVSIKINFQPNDITS